MHSVPSDVRGNVHSGKALIVEDIREVVTLLTDKGMMCERITHNELLSSAGTDYTGKLINGEYSMLWISTPNDWFVRTPSKKATTHWKRLQNWIKKAMTLGILLVIFGPPGFFWKIPNIKETLEEAKLIQCKVRLCHFGDRFDVTQSKPSGSYFQLATNIQIDTRKWSCHCKIPIHDHILDWYGRSTEQADWRRKISVKLTKAVCSETSTCSKAVKRQAFPTNDILDVNISPSPIDATTLPTEGRIRQKERLKKMKELGLKPKKKHKVIEAGNDDCGDDISGLGKDAVLLSYDTICEQVESSDDEDLFMTIPMTVTDAEAVTNIYTAVASLCYGKHREVDMVEFCGGLGGITKIGFKRGLACGGNFDLVTGCDLGDPATQRALNHYIDTCYVLVLILQPNCRTTGRFSHYNAIHHYDTWHKHHLEDKPHISYCGSVALRQMKHKRFWEREQPAGTWIDHVEPWPQVCSDPSVVYIIMDQCMTGAIDDQGWPVKKPTEWASNSMTLIKPLNEYHCDGSHHHGNPTGKALEKMKQYPHRLQNSVVTGIINLKKECRETVSLPNIATGSSDDGPSLPLPKTSFQRCPPGGLGCPACHQRFRIDSPAHTRDPKTCRHFDIPSVSWKCPSCQDDKGRNPRAADPGHSKILGECRFATIEAPHPTRIGAHPREPRPLAQTHPSAEAASRDMSEEAVERGDVHPAASSSSSGERGDVLPAGRGQDTVPRTRRTWTETGTGEARLPDWSRFNIQVSLKNLRSYVPEVVQKELRKLHLRWWHASEPKMRNILTSAGLDEIRLAMIKPIVDTCRECRAWQKRGNEIMPSYQISTKFNQHGETDLMFYKKNIGFHIIDRAIRLSDGCQIESKHGHDIINAYVTTWYQRNGPFEVLYTDGESGLVKDDSVKELKRLGTELRVRAPGQHARTAESRQSMLRHVMHLIEEDLKRHNDTIPFGRLYAEALFVVNAFTFYNGVSPYNAHTGRQPAFLPDFENPDFPEGGTPSSGDREQRIRETAIEAITQSTAVAKVNRSLKGKTSIDGARMYKPGDLVDFHRDTITKDESGGWNGPYPVVRNEPDRGQVVVAHGNREIRVRYPDARLTLYVETLIMKEIGDEHGALDTILHYIETLPAGKTPETFGNTITKGSSTLQLSVASKRYPKVYLALQYVIRNFFRINDVLAVRLGKSVHKVSPCSQATRSVLVYYVSEADPYFHFYESKDTALDIQFITQSPKARIIQCLCGPGSNITNDSPEITHELMQSSRQPSDPGSTQEMRGNANPDNPPTPQTIDVGGELPTIAEDSEEDDDLTLQVFYAELTSDTPLESGPIYEEPDPFRRPITMMPEDSILFMVNDDPDQELRGNVNPGPESLGDEHLEPCEISLLLADPDSEDNHIDTDDIGQYVELCFTPEMSATILDEEQLGNMRPQDIATMRVYISENTKRSVVVKEDDLLSKQDMNTHVKGVADATVAEIKKWLDNSCFETCDFAKAQNIMTSRYVAKWKWVKQADSSWSRVIRMRLCLRGFMDTEAFSLDTFSGTAKRTSQRIIASEAACHDDWIIASLDVNNAFLKGFTYKELAEATGEKERTVCFRLPPGSAEYLRKFPGFHNFDESKHCLRCIKPGTGTKDAPRAFSLKLRKTTKNVGLQSTSYDAEFEVKTDLLTAKHVDDINMSGTEKEIDKYTLEVEKVFDKCKLNKHSFTNCGVRHQKLSNGDVTMDQDDYISTLRPITSPELTGAAAEKDATKAVSDLFVSLRGALAYCTLTQAWIQVYIVSLQRVQQPKNLDIRRLNAVTRKLQSSPKKLVFPAMQCKGMLDIHTDSGYRRMTEVDDEKGYGMRGLCLLRQGIRRDKNGECCHLLDSICRSHKLTIRSSYAAETLAIAHGVDDAYPTLVTISELKHGVLSPTQLKSLREKGGLGIRVVLTTDAESVYKSLTSRDLKAPTERTLLGHVSWVRELVQLKIIESVQWCDTRDMTADGHTKGSIDRELLLEVMSGQQKYQHSVKTHTPFRQGTLLPVGQSVNTLDK